VQATTAVEASTTLEVVNPTVVEVAMTTSTAAAAVVAAGRLPPYDDPTWPASVRTCIKVRN